MPGLRAVTVAVSALAALALPAAASAERAYNVLPAGQYGGLPLTPNSTDQLSLYDALTPLGGNVGASDLTRYFKPENSAAGGRHDGRRHAARGA